MIKYAILFFNTIALLIYQLFFSDGITITQKAPSTAKIGTQFNVEITIHKGDVDGFAKLQQELPDGFTAEEGTSNGASFTFSNGAVKFIWMALPADKEFKVSYKVKVDNNIVTGDKFIGGKFSYIVNNAKQQVEIPSVTINVPPVNAPVATTQPAANTQKQDNSSATASIADSNTVSISGFYLDEKDVPIQGLKVNLMSGGVILQTTTTDKSGFFQFTKLAKDNSQNDVVMLDEKDTHFISKKSKAQIKDNKQVVIQEKELSGNTQAVAAKQPENTQPTASGVDMSNLTCSRVTPDKISGNSFDVELNLVKGNIGGFAKCVEVLPAGCTATAIESAGASFTFADNKVKFVWVSLPANSVMKLKYKVTVPEGTTGPVVLDGVFSYIENDETRKCTFNTNTVNVTPATSQPAVANTNEPVKTNEPAKVTEPVKTVEPVVAYQPESIKTPEPVKAPEPVATNTTEPVKAPEPVKTEEPVATKTPEPAKATEPVVAYQPEAIKPETVNVTEPVKAPEPEATKSPEPAKSPEPVANTNTPEPVKAPEPVKTPEALKAPEPVATKAPEPVATKAPEPVKAPEPAKAAEPAKPTAQASAVNNPALAASNVPAANTSISYAVQIAALRNAKEPVVLASYFKITEKVNTEMADGLTKYTVGSHKVYKDAHDAREVIKKKGVSDAWVTSYNAGKRITVQEALMVSAQKWYK
jgi:hypothetical protein